MPKYDKIKSHMLEFETKIFFKKTYEAIFRLSCSFNINDLFKTNFERKVRSVPSMKSNQPYQHPLRIRNNNIILMSPKIVSTFL